jgi:DNA-binding MarR family transcriptional regulator
VTLGHWTFLRILWERDGLTQRELSHEAGLMEPTTAAALRGMEQLGYITRRRLDGNRKNIYIYLTPAARALKKTLVPLAEDVNGLALRELNAGDVETTRRTLLVMLDNLASDGELGVAQTGAAVA